MSYVDGFVLPLPKGKEEDYRKMAEKGAQTWMKHGALDYKECILDDSNETEWSTTFEKSFHPKEGETIVFAYIVYKDRAHRDEVNAKVMAEMKEGDCSECEGVFDMKRMAYGGFKVLVEG